MEHTGTTLQSPLQERRSLVRHGLYSAPGAGHHGLGRSAAWTSDCKARWARRWLGTETYTRTFTQLVRWLAAAEGSSDINAYADLDRGILSVTVDAYDLSGGFRNFLQGEARFSSRTVT